MNEATRAQTKMAELLDKAMLEVLKEGGEPIVDNEGKIQLDGKGRVVRRRVSAATMNAIRTRLKDLGINNVRRPGTVLDELVNEAERRGLRYDGEPVVGSIPPVSDDEDAATA